MAEPPAGPGEAAGKASGFIHVVVQRCSRAKLLVDAEADTWTSIGRGLVIYVSFSKVAGAAPAGDIPRILRQAARSILGAPMASSAQWQADHADAESIVSLCGRGEPQGLLVVPQASLVAKLETGDKNLKYHQQCGKDDASSLYHGFVEALEAMARDLIAGPGPKHDAANYEALRAKRAAMSAVAPDQLFKTGEHEGKFSAYDERGVPTHNADGTEVTKSGAKKLEKLYAAQVKKYAKADASGGQADASGGPPDGEDAKASARPEESPWGPLDEVPFHLRVEDGLARVADSLFPPAQAEGGAAGADGAPQDAGRPASEAPELPEGACLPDIRHGTFGGRQGFAMESNGPLTHAFVF